MRVFPPLLAVALVIWALWHVNNPRESLPAPRPGVGPLWADGERVTEARTGRVMVWRAAR